MENVGFVDVIQLVVCCELKVRANVCSMILVLFKCVVILAFSIIPICVLQYFANLVLVRCQKHLSPTAYGRLCEFVTTVIVAVSVLGTDAVFFDLIM
jgi:hypothetical protein